MLVFYVLFLILVVFVTFKPAPFLKFGYWGVYVFNLVGPGTLLIPSLSRYMNVFWLAVISAAGMTTNDSISWLAGKSGDVVLPRSKRIERLEKTVSSYGPWFFYAWSVLPLPYDIIGLVAGYLEFSYKSFAIPSFLGKLTRFILLGTGVVAVWGKVL